MFLKGVLEKRSLWLSAILLIILLALPPVIPRYYTYIMTLIFVMALLSMSLNMVVGHGGLFQFHHGVFYGVGAYAFALTLVKAKLPMWLCFAVSPIVAAMFGFLIGWFCVRLTKLYFGMLQISLGSLLWAITFRWYGLTGGDDGIHGIAVPRFFVVYDECLLLRASLLRALPGRHVLDFQVSIRNDASGHPRQSGTVFCRRD